MDLPWRTFRRFFCSRDPSLGGGNHSRSAREERELLYADVVHILATYDPDLICVEIRPQDFRREPYLKEMMLATV